MKNHKSQIINRKSIQRDKPPQRETAVIYKSVRCPDCRSTRVPVKRTGPSTPDYIIRHHKCGECGHIFKSIEKIK